jgi:hypothetical protein
MPSMKEMLKVALIAIVAVAIVNNIGLTRNVVTPAAPRF